MTLWIARWHPLLGCLYSTLTSLLHSLPSSNSLAFEFSFPNGYWAFVTQFLRSSLLHSLPLALFAPMGLGTGWIQISANYCAKLMCRRDQVRPCEMHTKNTVLHKNLVKTVCVNVSSLATTCQLLTGQSISYRPSAGQQSPLWWCCRGILSR